MNNQTNIAVDKSNIIEQSRYIPRMVSLKEAAKLTGLSEIFLRKGFKSGELVGVRCGTSSGGKILLNLDRLIEYLDSHTEQPENEPTFPSGHIRPVKL